MKNLKESNSGIHKAAGSLVTGRSQNAAIRNAPLPETVPAGGSHAQTMDTFLYHRNYTCRSHVMAGNHEVVGSLNSPVIKTEYSGASAT